ncbi:hypothetical protein BJ165DRAFT_1593085 [Panaeolus papilionaceus]|nr:hypothetical protein BJ165DRAFT_1593085 [Panaeolus papilionaceus]
MDVILSLQPKEADTHHVNNAAATVNAMFITVTQAVLGDPITSQEAEEFQSVVVKAHLLRSTLHTLEIRYLPHDITIMDIIGSTSLRSLLLQECPNFGQLSFTIGRPCTISHLHVVAEYPITPLILLDYLPNLTHLQIIGGWSTWTAAQDDPLDIIPTRTSGSTFNPSNLKRIRVESVHVPLFFQYCVDRRVHADVPLLASLEEFSLCDGREAGVEVVRDMLKETRSLRSLTIAGSPQDSSEEFSFEIYGLSARFTDGTLSKRTDLYLIIQDATYAHHYTAAIDGLVSLFTLMTQLNVLERIELSFYIVDVPPKGSVFDAQQPNQDLRPVADSLACVGAYPALEEVQIEIWVWLKRESRHFGKKVVSTRIDGMQTLRCRPGVVVRDTLVIRY